MKTNFIRFTFLFAILIFNTLSLFGQNYKTVHADREAYFESEEFGMGYDGWSSCHPCRFGIRVKEIAGGNTQYVFPTYWDTSNNIVDTVSSRFSWMGDTLQFLSDGTELFRNKNEETITIKPRIEIGESWTMFDLGGGQYLEATMTEKNFETVFNQMDSIKTFIIQAKDSNDENIDHEMNDFSFRVGKSTGFIEIFDLYHFPTRMEKINLIGMSNPAVGEELLSAKSIYDFQVGDERLYINGDEFDATYKKITTLEREDVNPDSVRYLFHVHEVRQVATNNDLEYSHSEEEVYRSYNVADEQELNIHPYEVINSSSGVEHNRYNSIGKNADGKWYKSFYTNPINLFFNSGQTYQACLGHTQRYYQESIDVHYNEQLIYYKKGNTEWGNDVDLATLTAAKEIQNPKSSILLFPNPSNDNITISNKGPTKKLQHIQVLNSLGQKIADWPCEDQQQVTKSVADFPEGIYWLLVADENDEVWRLNFIKN